MEEVQKLQFSVSILPFHILFVCVTNGFSIFVTNPISQLQINMEGDMFTIYGHSWLMITFLIKDVQQISKHLQENSFQIKSY